MATTTPFDLSVWSQALEKFGAVSHLSVALYDADGLVIHDAQPDSPVASLFAQYSYDPGVFAGCAQQCLAQTTERPAIVSEPHYGFTVVGTSLFLGDQIVGAAVGGYAMADFCQSPGITRLAQLSGVPFRELWDLARRLHPVPARRLSIYGELLQVLGDTLLRETARTRQYEDTAAELRVVAASKDEFIAVLSHELRTPLSPILGWARILRTSSDPTAVRAADVIERNARLQVRLVDDLLELNRAAQGKVVLDRKSHDLVALARAALEAVADIAEKKQIRMVFIDAIEPLMVMLDEDRIQQVLRNVLSNALKFTPSGGVVTVTVTSNENETCVSIMDTGEGIAAEFLPFAFEMFRQQDSGTQRRHTGLGIGLALVKQLTEAHGGSVAIASPGAGLGTVVTLSLPKVIEVEQTTEVPVSSSTALSGIRILVVDDMEDVRDATREMLMRFGAEVTTAQDGLEAIHQATAHDSDVVLCDLRMPRMDGFEFIRALRLVKGHATQPVIAISAHASPADHQRTAAAGFNDHIDKPFDDKRLLAAVSSVMARRPVA